MTAYIGYDNAMESSGATITASSEATASGTQTFDVENAYDWLMFDYWKPSASGNATIECSFSVNTTVDYIAAWGQQSGTRYQLEYSDDGVTWAALSSVKTLDGASFDKFASVSVPSGVTENLLTYSEQFDNAAWAKTNCTVTANAAVAPDGSITADLVEATVDGNDYIAQTYSTTGHAGKTYTFSAWLKNVDRSGELILRIRDGGGAEAGNKTVTMTSDWQRFEVTGTFGASPTSNIIVYIDPLDNTSNAGLGYYAWGAQLEESSSARAYAQTTSSTFSGTVPTARLRLYPKQNLLFYSEEYVTGWTLGSNTTRSVEYDPDLGCNVAVLTATGSGNVFLTRSHGLPAGKYTFSAWVRVDDISAFGANARLITARYGSGGAVATTTAITPTTESLTEGEWKRVSITFAHDGVGSSGSINIYFGFDWTSGGVLRGAKAQLEEAPSAGEYQATTSAAIKDTVQLPMVSFGEALELGGIRPGFAPPRTIEHGEATNSVSEDGHFLGRSVRTTGQSMNIQQTVVVPAYVRSNLYAFSQHALRKPFFFSWDEANYPNEAALIVPGESGGVSAPEYESPLYMRFTIRGQAWK